MAAALALALAGCGSEPGADVRGREAPTERETPVVVAAGDIACDPDDESFNGGRGRERNCRQAHTARLVRRIRPDVVLGLGDFQYEYGTSENFRRSYDRSWGSFKRKTWATAGGSHDFYGGGDYYRYFGKRAGPKPFKPYSIEIGDWHVVSLNAQCEDERVGGCDVGSPQWRWLVDDLEPHVGKRCILAFWHDPRWASRDRHAGEEDLAPLVDELYDAGADLILSGHNHNYERFAPQDPEGDLDEERGIVQFVVGTGGKSLDDDFKEIAENSVVRNGETFGVLKLRLHRRSYDFEFVPEREGGFEDSGSRRCNAFR